ncbi:MAG: heavy-metal-associated domain-containing protein [Thiolinea sp.]
MNNHHVTVVVHIDEELPLQERQILEADLAGSRGIHTARTNEQRQHLMLVDYDAGQVHSSQLLNEVRQHGYHAQLVGW